jgi:hypothetical protein
MMVAPSALAEKTGRDMNQFDACFGLSKEAQFKDIQVTFFQTNAPGCIYYPGQQPSLQFQIFNKTGRSIVLHGRYYLKRYGTRAVAGNIWVSDVVPLSPDGVPTPFEMSLKPHGWADVTLEPQLPDVKGGYGLVLDLGEAGRDFLVGLTRVFKPQNKPIQYPSQALDYMPAPVLERLGIQSIRFPAAYMHSDDPERARYMQQIDEEMRAFMAHGITLSVEIGGGNPHNDFTQPIKGFLRTHLTDDGVAKDGKFDLCWMPQYDADFEAFVYQLALNYGWPKGPITSLMLWNEPWEGISISGWQADMLRYRKIYQHMASGVHRAEKDGQVDVLVGGCDSSTNTWDKLFPDGKDTFMPDFDFCSIHYQGMGAPALYKAWNNRKLRKGRVLIWDTESWVANTDDRVAGLFASNRAAGYDRSVGVHFSNVTTQLSHRRVKRLKLQTDNGINEVIQPVSSWSTAASVNAAQHFLGERAFKDILFKNGLPWVYIFQGLDANPDDGTVVVLGDLGSLFNNHDGMLHRTVRSLAEVRDAQALRSELDRLEPDDPRYAKRNKQLHRHELMRDATLTLDAHDGLFTLYDFYGNPVPTRQGKIVIPLDANGYFLRADPQRAGSFAQLLQAIQSARIDGLQPVEIVAQDMLKPIADHPVMAVSITNVLNRAVKGKLQATVEGLDIDVTTDIELAAHQTRQFPITVRGGQAVASNAYRLSMQVDLGSDGVAYLHETMHVNQIARRTMVIDGKLDDWSGVLPQSIASNQRAGQTVTEAAWLPFVPFDPGADRGMATGYLAYDDDYFYFAAKVADDSPNPGTLRFETRDDDAFFYPPTVYRNVKTNDGTQVKQAYHWPDDVRRYSYRKSPILPFSGPFDNVQIAFNTTPIDQDPDWLSHLPGRMPGFIYYKDTDYEYALNTVSPAYGGGTEIWRLMAPGMPRVHFYPRQPKHPLVGPVKAGKLVTLHQDQTRIVETAIPWSELPQVRALLDAGKTVKFSFAVNNDTGGPLLELAADRSVSRINSQTFHPDWRKHWANEVAFAFEKQAPKQEQASDNPTKTQTALDEIGTWDGKTMTATLQRPYEDRLQAEIPFGDRSYYLAPWRAYMDTWPGRRYTEALGATMNRFHEHEVDAVATLLAEAGFSHARVEMGWGHFNYDDPMQLEKGAEKDRRMLAALHRNGIRPLILLNAHESMPVPHRKTVLQLSQVAPKGSRTVTFDNVDQIKPGYTGFRLREKRNLMGYPLITEVDRQNRTCTLSAPLPEDLKPGRIELWTMRYHPFGGATLEDGSPNAYAQQTVDGWLEYVRAVAEFAKQAMGTEHAADAGFDLEVWNEMTFGSVFLNEKYYYDPPRKFSKPITYSRHGQTVKGFELILPLTVDACNDPASGMPGVGVISGFANQRPWESGTAMWPGQMGFGRHYYTGIEPANTWNGKQGTLSPETELDQFVNRPVLDARGRFDGSLISRWKVQPTNNFIPTLNLSMPEFHSYGYKTEHITRDIMPFPGPWVSHYRYAHTADGQRGELWRTEFNTARHQWARWLRDQHGIDSNTPGFSELMHAIGAKCMLRATVFDAHKGTQVLCLFTLKDNDESFAVIPERFFKLLRENNGQLTDAIREAAGPQLATIKRVSQLLSADVGMLSELGFATQPQKVAPIAEACPLTVEQLVEHKPRLVFRGDGTPGHPDVFGRDDFAVLPYQLDEKLYAIGFYVVTRNVIHAWDKSRDRLDPKRYTMPDQDFDLKLGNICGKGAKVAVYDPMTGKQTPVERLDGDATSLTVRVAAVDYPRFLLVGESDAGPLILQPRLVDQGSDASVLSFRTNLPVTPTVTWGEVPSRWGQGERTLSQGTEHRVVLPRLAENVGVKIRIQANGLTASWPRWDYDTAGVLRWTAFSPQDSAKPLAAMYLPALPSARPATSYRFASTEDIKLNTDGSFVLPKSLIGVQVQMQIMPVMPENVLSILPQLSHEDQMAARSDIWADRDCWLFQLRLDPDSHPEITTSQQTQFWYVLPYRQGLLILKFATKVPGDRVRQAMNQILDGFHFQ